MARLVKLAELEARKKALIAEAEIYRQTLKAELRNVQLYVAGTGRKLNHFKSLFAIVPIGSSLLGLLAAGLFRRRKSKGGWPSILPTAMMGWRLYQKYGPMVQPFLGKFMNRKRDRGTRGEERKPADNG
jgi:hypothetical protein